MLPSPGPRHAALAALLAALASRDAGAQLAGVPVLQGAFLRPGLIVAANAGSADDGSGVGGALAWGIGRERLAFVAGVGRFMPPDRFSGSATTYGARLAVTALTLAGGQIAVTPFAGAGRVRLERDVVRPGGGAATAVTTGFVRVPAGVSVGYRRALGTRGALALFAAPMYAFSRADSSGAENDGVARVAVGAELALATRFGAFGLTAGFEVGQGTPENGFGPRGGAFGIGVGLARGGRPSADAR